MARKLSVSTPEKFKSLILDEFHVLNNQRLNMQKRK